MAVYNEAETVATAIERVLAVEIEDVEIELVVVESNSTDGTREVVSRYATDPRVRSSSRKPREARAPPSARDSST